MDRVASRDAGGADLEPVTASRRIVLASTSSYRRALLLRLGVPFDVASPGVDEDAAKALGLAPQMLAQHLAHAKAAAIAANEPDAIIIGSDQCAEVDGAVLGKPGTAANAERQLQRLAGRTHHLWTGVTVLDTRNDARLDHVDLHRLTMRALDASQLAAYVARDQPLDCAGAYKIEGLGGALFERVVGEDATAIEGLPLSWVSRALYSLGVDVLAG